eukprot:CAMPEP_0118801644 /NCGR_PEP_ID=MMETSP1161-20130426/3119_1 /TAXON_ID=249345 /ORGANISM="Picochlorum oklahomensis, Strain CCMP2329" /LENGTH=438 /DNA_ID=CAMNT_0006729599 /DNA_START=48 /DNA_END=1364 /DNA_ORIENTATION=-
MEEYPDGGLQSDLSQSAAAQGVSLEEDSFAIRKRGPPKRVSEEEKREKNKVIQKRYREKKKQLRLETEKKLKQAVEQLRQEQSEYYARKLRLQLLENILKFKGDAVEALETNRSSSFSSRRSRDTVLGTMASSRTIDDADTPLEESSSSLCVGSMIKSVKEIAVKVKDAAPARQELLESTENPSDLDLLQVEEALDAMRVAIKSMPKTEESSAIFQDFKPGDLMKFTKEFAKNILRVFDDVNLPTNLVCKDNTPEYDEARKAAVARLLPVYEEYLVVVNIALQHHPNLCVELLPQVGTESQLAAQKQKTIEILKDMNVGEEQRNKIRKLRREFLQQQADRLRNVSRHYWQLEDKFEPNLNDDSNAGNGMYDVAQQYMSYFDASGAFVEKFAADMQLEHMLRFMRDVGITFTVLQKCVMFAQSYPDFPNIVAVCDAMED